MKKLLFILPLLYYSCTDDIIADIDALQTENAEQDAQIDSLLTVITTQQEYIDSMNNVQNAYIDSLISESSLNDSLLQVYTDSLNTVQNTLNADQQAYIDSLINLGNVSDSLLQVYTDSLNTVQNTYIDSLHNAQQTTLEALANSALSAGFVETEVFSGTIPSSWTDVDLSSVVGQKQSLVILEYEYISGGGIYHRSRIKVRPNGSSNENGDFDIWSIGGIYVSDGGEFGDESHNSLTLIQTDTAGIIEHKEILESNAANVTASVVFYLNN